MSAPSVGLLVMKLVGAMREGWCMGKEEVGNAEIVEAIRTQGIGICMLVVSREGALGHGFAACLHGE